MSRIPKLLILPAAALGLLLAALVLSWRHDSPPPVDAPPEATAAAIDRTEEGQLRARPPAAPPEVTAAAEPISSAPPGEDAMRLKRTIRRPPLQRSEPVEQQ